MLLKYKTTYEPYIKVWSIDFTFIESFLQTRSRTEIFLFTTIACIIIFFIFKIWNNGNIKIISDSNNLVNMSILLLFCLALSLLWINNGEEGMGWGAM